MGKKIASVYSVAVFLWVLVAFHLIIFFSDLYSRYDGLDKISHLLGGFWLAVFFSYLIIRLDWPSQSFFTILGWVALFAIFWEFHEFVADIFIKSKNFKMQISASDTTGDLFFGLLGASIFLVWKKLLSLMGEKN